MHIRRILLPCLLALLAMPSAVARMTSPAASSNQAKPPEAAAPTQANPSEDATVATQRQLQETPRRLEATQQQMVDQMLQNRWRNNGFDDFLRNVPPLIGFLGFFLLLAWVTKQFVESRRWSRTFRAQSEVHSHLIDKFSTSQELAAYMETEAGRRFLEAAPIPLDAGPQRMPNAVARILMPLQIGTVMILLGVGFLTLRHLSPDYEIPMRVLGTLILMPGIGFILSAGLTWLLAARLGMVPPSYEGPGASTSADVEPHNLIQR